MLLSSELGRMSPARLYVLTGRNKRKTYRQDQKQPRGHLFDLALQLFLPASSESMGNHDSDIVDADGVG
jgi:hypothetical protein